MRVVDFHMNRPCNQFKIFNSIVSLVTVRVMDNIRFRQALPQVFCHYQAMFQHIVLLSSHRIIGVVRVYLNQIVSIYKYSPTLPTMTLVSEMSSAHVLQLLSRMLASKISKTEGLSFDDIRTGEASSTVRHPEGEFYPSCIVTVNTRKEHVLPLLVSRTNFVALLYGTVQLHNYSIPQMGA